MDEQLLRSEIDSARSIRFPSDPLEQKKATLRDLYYKSLNQQKIFAVNCPEDKKEEHIQSILSTAAAMEALEAEIILEDPSWLRPEGIVLNLYNSPLLSDAEASAAHIFGSRAEITEQLFIAGLPVSAQSWPIGSVFISISSANPANILGFGIWAQIALGRMLIGVDENDVDFDSAEKIGGEKQVILTEDQMPEHTHQQLPHTHQLTGGAMDDNVGPFAGPDSSKSLSDPFAGGIAATVAENLPSGGNNPHNNLPPYFSVYIFKREA